MLVQVVTAIIRITTSYRAFELDLSIVWLGLIAAAFAAFPIVMAVQVGRFIDRGNDALTIWIGSAIFAMACGRLRAVADAPWDCVVVTTVMGIGHIMLMASQQMLCVRAAGSPRAMESVFGNYMVAGAIGQGAGPYIVGWAGGSATVPPTQLLFIDRAASAPWPRSLVSLTMRPRPDKPKISPGEKPVPVAQPAAHAGAARGDRRRRHHGLGLRHHHHLRAAARRRAHIDVKDIGLLLTVRAAASMVARLFYARMVAAAGRWPLMIASTIACAAAFGALAAPVPLPGMYAIMAVMGFSFGLATTLSITIVVDMTRCGARGTANSLRIMGNRLGQFVLPFSAGLVAAVAGLAGLFAGMAAAILASAAAMDWKRPG